MTFTRTQRTTSMRNSDKLRYDKATAFDVLDAGYICHIGYTTKDGPAVLPTAYARVGETVYVHGSTGSCLFLAARDEGVALCFAVTLHDGFVYSRSWFHHSVNYRCVIAHGRAHSVDNPEEKQRALAAMVDRLGANRSQQSRPPDDKETAQTAVLALPLQEVSVKVRSGGPNDDPEDAALPYWAGEVPLLTTAGSPIPDVGVDVDVPDGLAR